MRWKNPTGGIQWPMPPVPIPESEAREGAPGLEGSERILSRYEKRRRGSLQPRPGDSKSGPSAASDSQDFAAILSVV